MQMADTKDSSYPADRRSTRDLHITKRLPIRPFFLLEPGCQANDSTISYTVPFASKLRQSFALVALLDYTRSMSKRAKGLIMNSLT